MQYYDVNIYLFLFFLVFYRHSQSAYISVNHSGEFDGNETSSAMK